MSVTIFSFCFFLVLIIFSGALSIIRKRKTPKDYLVASREVPPWLTSLSTVATNNSSFMFTVRVNPSRKEERGMINSNQLQKQVRQIPQTLYSMGDPEEPEIPPEIPEPGSPPDEFPPVEPNETPPPPPPETPNEQPPEFHY